MSLVLATMASTAAAGPSSDPPEERWFRLPIVPRTADEDLIDDALEIVDEAKSAGYTHLLIGDTFMQRRVNQPAIYPDWTQVYQRVRARAKAGPNPMQIVLTGPSFGRCEGSLLPHNANLATGYPMYTPVSLGANGELVASFQPQVSNGNFTEFDGRFFAGFSGYGPTDVTQGFGPNGGSAAVVSASRVTNINLNQELDVIPYTQYRANLRLRADQLTAGRFLLEVVDVASGQKLSTLQVRNGNSFTISDMTTDWTTYSVAFNSTTARKARLRIVVGGLSEGEVSFDQLSVQAAPTLNLLDRGDLNTEIALNRADGTRTIIPLGAGFQLKASNGAVVQGDPQLGNSAGTGRFDVLHDGPKLIATSNELLNLGPNDRMTFRSYHALVHFQGNVSCSWNSQAALDEYVATLSYLVNTFEPDGLYIPHDEIRSGGWEPRDGTDPSLALENNLRKVMAATATVAPGVPIVISHDMVVDPIHNPVVNSYHVRPSLDRAITVPDGVAVMVWDDDPVRRGNDDEARRVRTASLAAIAQQTDEILVGAYYDTADIARDAQLWRDALAAAPEADAIATGVLYATWGRGNHDDLRSFANNWWLDRPLCNGLAVTVDIGQGQQPTGGDDVILGTDGDDVIKAGAGNDSICGGGGDDVLNGESGNDTIFGHDGNDTLVGGSGDDRLFGQVGDDGIYGQWGDDDLFGGPGNDTIIGGPGADDLYGGPGLEDVCWDEDGDPTYACP